MFSHKLQASNAYDQQGNRACDVYDRSPGQGSQYQRRRLRVALQVHFMKGSISSFCKDVRLVLACSHVCQLAYGNLRRAWPMGTSFRTLPFLVFGRVVFSWRLWADVVLCLGSIGVSWRSKAPLAWLLQEHPLQIPPSGMWHSVSCFVHAMTFYRMDLCFLSFVEK